MSLAELGHILFLVLVAVFAGVLLLFIPLWLALTILTPRSFLDRFFKEPHFTIAETIMLSRYPGALLRTSIFGWALFLQPLGFKGFRNLDDVRQAMPNWYAYGLYFLTVYWIFSLVLGVLLFFILFGMKFYMEGF